ncbi:hypothetical protein L6452_12517 [Arctium lappa]|uniref:Uncharacterized protein n=1 Tax=Arctium lappa TaxID=4217 RepID=A0ACB9DR28_ARCLA|nr:hypothetical protein L6452_12517 [Arctium lappa]
MDRAIEYLDTMVSRGCYPVKYHTLLTTLCKDGKVDFAIEILNHLILEGCPILITYNIVIDRLSKIGKIGIAIMLIDEMKQKGLQPNIIMYSSIFCIPDLKTPKPSKLADMGLEEFPLCMAVNEPQYFMSGNVKVLLGIGDHVFLVEEDGVQIVDDGLGPLQKMVVSHNGKLMASFTHDGQLLVMPTDFSNIIFEYSCEVGL